MTGVYIVSMVTDISLAPGLFDDDLESARDITYFLEI